MDGVGFNFSISVKTQILDYGWFWIFGELRNFETKHLNVRRRYFLYVTNFNYSIILMRRTRILSHTIILAVVLITLVMGDLSQKTTVI